MSAAAGYASVEPTFGVPVGYGGTSYNDLFNQWLPNVDNGLSDSTFEPTRNPLLMQLNDGLLSPYWETALYYTISGTNPVLNDTLANGAPWQWTTIAGQSTESGLISALEQVSIASNVVTDDRTELFSGSGMFTLDLKSKFFWGNRKAAISTIALGHEQVVFNGTPLPFVQPLQQIYVSIIANWG